MADRYWVGGTASWDGTAGTKWATTSGGAGGASVPTTADDVFFDAASTGTVTIATGNTGAKSINCTGFTGTITGSTAITVAGGVTLVSGMTYTHTGTVTISGTGTLVTAGKTFSGLNVNGTGITVTLGDALNTGGRDLTVTAGTFDTASYSVTAGRFISTSAITRVITLGSSTVNITSGPVTVDFGSSSGPAAGLTLNAGTSNINITYTAGQTQFRTGNNLTFYNVSYAGVANVNRLIFGPTTATFNNLTFTNSGAGISSISLSVNFVVNGTLTCSGVSFDVRNFIFSDARGTQRTITANAISGTDCDFRDINLAGAAAGSSITRAGDCGGNSGITFPTPKTVYRVGNNSTTWAGSSSWATSSGGAGSNNNFPLAQDTAVVDDSTTGSSISLGNYNLSGLDASTRTTAYSIAFSTTGYWHGSVTLSSSISVSGSSSQLFYGSGTMVLTSAGRTFGFPVTVDTPTGTLLLGDALTMGASNSFFVLRGTFDAASYNVTCGLFNSSNTNTRTINMGSGTWTILSTGGTPWDTTTVTNLTFNKGTSNLVLAGNIGARTFQSGGLSFYKLTIGGATNTSSFSIVGAASFVELASTRTVAYSIILNNNLGTIDTWTVKGSSGALVTFVSNTAGTRRTFNLTNITTGLINYLAVKDIGVNQTNRFYVGTGSVDNGNNLNVLFSTSPVNGVTSSFMVMF